jgi:2-hydroxycyclohexanecarboxyl-CoA dehydrogenase
MKRDFRSKVVFITGGGGGIGSAAGKLFCAAGAAVALVDLDASAAKDDEASYVTSATFMIDGGLPA